MKLNQVTLPVNNMKAAVQFYLTLGCTQIVDTPEYARFTCPEYARFTCPEYARFTCPEGDATFSLSLEEEAFENHSVIYFEHENLGLLCETLIEKGIVFEQLPTDQPYLWKEDIIKDPSGNKIKLYWAGENRLNPPWKVEKRA